MPASSLNIFKKALEEAEVITTKGLHFDQFGKSIRNYFFSVNTARDTLVFLHATGNDCLFPQLPLYLKVLAAGFNIFCFDLDGHGHESESELNRETIWTTVDRAANYLKDTYGIDRFHLAGQSLGGVLCLDYAAREPKKISSLSLISTPLKIDVSLQAYISEAGSVLKPAFYKHILNYGLIESLPAFGGFKREKFPVRINGASNQDYISYVTNLIGTSNIEAAVNQVSCPTLICCGTNDFISTTKDAEKLFREIENSAMVEVPENHFTTLFSDTVETAILDHLCGI